MSGRVTLNTMAPFFIVADTPTTLAWYVDKLGFDILHYDPADAPWFAIVVRGGAMLFLKAGEAAPLPNPARDPSMRWDAYVNTDEPDGLWAEFAARGGVASTPLCDTEDGLRGFELTDPDGHVLFFGRPR